MPRVTAPERRESILAAAREVFLESGLAGARTKEIADRAGINEALIYRHFRSKDELFTEAIVDPLAVAIRHYLGRHRTGETQINVADARRTTEGSIGALQRQMAQLAPPFLVLLAGDAGRQTYAEHIAPLFAEWQRDIETAFERLPHRDLDARLLATVVFATCFWCGLEGYFGEGECRERSVAAQLTDLIFSGIERREP
ncbi:MAG TPA: helix-turn-helix domain-containing protein [Mycobacteriales bacterium]|nr:helix-turn-helix domain-containing protein [Mycobacteriales bacterium]